MPITQQEAGNYLGYTLGGNMPTLYFEKGRYTQIHGDAANIGWHPKKVENENGYRGRNIFEERSAEYNLLRKNRNEPGNAEKKKAFIEEFLTGTFDYADGLFFEASKNEAGVWLAHPSRGKFFGINDPDFEQAFDGTYANDVLQKGVLAPNEH